MSDLELRSDCLNEYPLVEYVFSLIEENLNDEESINILLEKIGQIFELNMIVIKEISKEENYIKCTHEWSSDGKRELLDTERRFIEESEWSAWEERFKNDPDGVLRYFNGDGQCPLKLIRKERVESFIQIPLYRDGAITGSIEFIDSAKRTEWDSNDIKILKQLSRVLTSYLVHRREYEKNNESLRKHINYDPITRLPKYERFYEEVRSNFPVGRGVQLVVASVDLSNFKYINEKYGYISGNKMLRSFAKQIYELSGKIVSSCRAFSDNFLILLKCSDEVSEAKVLEYVANISDKMAKRMRDEYFDCNVIINTGIYMIKSSDDNIEAAISNANLARKAAKRKKANSGHRCLIFDSSISENVKKNADYVSTLESALQSGDVYVNLQPKVMCDTLEIIGAEALVRWRKDGKDVLLPDAFLPALEKDGCIVKLDYYVYEQVFKYLKKRIENNLDIVPVSMNVSIMHLYDDKIVHFIESMLTKYNVPASYIELEFTEYVYISNLPYVGKNLEKLRMLGVKVFIDDFGTGYSALNALTKYKIDGIKLDRIFMKKKLEKTDKIIISCIVDMANKLNLQVFCEGVETEEQRDYLMKIGCPYMQGNYYSKPVDIVEFDSLLDREY